MITTASGSNLLTIIHSSITHSEQTNNTRYSRYTNCLYPDLQIKLSQFFTNISIDDTVLLPTDEIMPFTQSAVLAQHHNVGLVMTKYEK